MSFTLRRHDIPCTTCVPQWTYTKAPYQPGWRGSLILDGFISETKTGPCSSIRTEGHTKILLDVEVLKISSLTPQMEDYIIRYHDKRIIDIPGKKIVEHEPSEWRDSVWRYGCKEITKEQVIDVCSQLGIENPWEAMST